MSGPGHFAVLFAVLFVAPATLAWQTAPEAYFEQNCSVCHTIGGGPSVGPDLKNVAQAAPRHWLVEFIRNPDAKVAAKDPHATKIVAEADGAVMPGFPDITEEFGEGLLEYIDRQSGAPAASAPPPVEGDAARGRELFLGTRRSGNGAAACIACHQASGLPLAGGRLGPNLSAVHQKLGGDHGLTSWLRKPPTPLMSETFRTASLTAEEAADLAVFLRPATEDTSRRSEVARGRVQAIGIGGSLLAFMIAGVIWRGRLATHGVRRRVLRNRGGQ